MKKKEKIIKLNQNFDSSMMQLNKLNDELIHKENERIESNKIIKVEIKTFEDKIKKLDDEITILNSKLEDSDSKFQKIKNIFNNY